MTRLPLAQAERKRNSLFEIVTVSYCFNSWIIPVDSNQIPFRSDLMRSDLDDPTSHKHKRKQAPAGEAPISSAPLQIPRSQRLGAPLLLSFYFLLFSSIFSGTGLSDFHGLDCIYYRGNACAY